MRLIQKLFNSTLNNVIFGITLMVLVALYIALGSGIPSLREHFEMNELEFFDTWVLKGLMFFLCLTLAIVTWNRIPLTPPRYGVWCIHCGIITLVIGTSVYYHLKVEGRTVIPVDRTAYYFYDSAERALYARVKGWDIVGSHRLPSLPRFKSYSPELGNSNQLHGSDLSRISRMTPVSTRPHEDIDLSSLLGVKEKVQMDVIGFYPYAEVVQDVDENPASNNVGVEIKIDSPHDGGADVSILTASNPTAAKKMFDSIEVEHRDVSEADLAKFTQSIQHMFHLKISLPGQPAQDLDVPLGKACAVPGTGYTLTADSFDPQFRMTTQELVHALTIHVVSVTPAPKQEFWRMILQGKELQTDFKMDPATTPPMVKGNRQKEPLDKNLVVGFTFSDPGALLPLEGDQKHTLITSPGALTDIYTAFDRPAEIHSLGSGGAVDFFHDNRKVQLRRVDHVAVSTRLIETPEAKRDKETADSGEKQVALVRVTCGNWSQEVPVPFDLYPVPDPTTEEPFLPWNNGLVYVPGALAPLQLQLGNTSMPLRAQLTLKKLEMVHYAGGEGENGLMRRISSILEMKDAVTGERSVAVCTLNDPVYYDGGRWLFFQAGYDPKGEWSVIGVGSRPGVLVMITGCVMIVLGLMYAFYVKPIVIRRMKANALARFAQAQSARPKSAKRGLQTERVS